jgi:hypothetical protein
MTELFLVLLGCLGVIVVPIIPTCVASLSQIPALTERPTTRSLRCAQSHRRCSKMDLIGGALNPTESTAGYADSAV